MTNIKITNEGIIRKVDNLGRIVIPKGIRSRFNINENDEMEVVTFYDESGAYCVGFKAVSEVDPKYSAAVAVLEELGCEVPPVLLDIVEKEQ